MCHLLRHQPSPFGAHGGRSLRVGKELHPGLIQGVSDEFFDAKTLDFSQCRWRGIEILGVCDELAAAAWFNVEL
jgi:hypothetical protein